MTTKPPLRVGAGRRALARLNAALALFLLVAGGMVTSTASGMAVPDWPKAYGTWLPAMTGGVFFEHGHRLIASLVGLTILIMAFWTQAEETRPGVRRLAWWTLFAVCLQGALGGITVFYNLPVQVSAAHATLGQTVFCLLIVMDELLSGEAAAPEARPAGGLFAMGLLAVGALWLQLVIGAVLRHSSASIVWHLLGAAVASLAAGAFGAAVLNRRAEASLSGPALALLALLGLQLMLGLATADFRSVPAPRADYAMIAVATTHLAAGAFLLGTTTLLTFRLSRLGAD